MLDGQVEKNEDMIKDTVPRNQIFHQVTQENFLEEDSCA